MLRIVDDIWRPSQIISGGQTGADQGGLLAATELAIPTGGTAPHDWLTEAGPREQLLRGLGLMECPEPGYDSRTKMNVLDADGTVIFGSYASGGSALTAKIAREAGKPLFHVPFPALHDGHDKKPEFRQWLVRFRISILNVAGNRESQNRGLQEFVKKFLVEALHPS
jgi:Circularly permutated YpsA SLOG family